MTTQLLRYLLAVAARRYAVELHAFCFLSNHYHLVLTDRTAQLPAFVQFFDALVARSVNAHRGRWESFWAPDTFSAVVLASPGDVLDKAAYALANPVAAGLVRAARQWPGLWSAPSSIGAGPVVVARPTHFFGKKSTLPASATLELCAPAGFASTEDFVRPLAAQLAEREAAAVRTRAGAGFLGVLRVLSQRPTRQPRDPEARRRLSPRVASRDRWRRAELLLRLKSFLAAYREALQAWRRGERGACFPEGTYLMRVAHGVACAGAG